MLGKKGGTGFPYLVFLDADGEIISKYQGNRSVDSFKQTGEKAKAFASTRAKAEKGDRKAKIEFLTLLGETGSSNYTKAKELAAGLGDLQGADRKRVNDALFNIEYYDLLAQTADKKVKTNEMHDRVVAWFDKKTIPTAPDAIVSFFNVLALHAGEKPDIDLYKKIRDALTPRAKDDPRLATILKNVEAKISSPDPKPKK